MATSQIIQHPIGWLLAVYLVYITGVTSQDPTADEGNPKDCKLDLAILVDVSGSIVNDRQAELGQSKQLDEEIMQNWYAVTNFTSAIIRRVDVGEEETHVAMVTFSNQVTEIFGLSLYDKSEMLTKVKDLADNLIPDGRTNAFGALTRARDDIFTIGGPGNRPDVVDVIIMITDGAPTVEFGGNNEILQETDSLKSRGFTIYAVGVGDKVNATLLQLMVNRPNSTHYFPVDNFLGLGQQLETIINQTCQVKPVDDFSVDCTIDLAFLLDSSGSLEGGPESRNWDQVIDFTIRMARSYNWNATHESDKPHISAITFSTEAELAFDLTSHKNEDDYLRALSNITYLGGSTNTAAALRLAYQQIFSAAGGDRAGVQNVVVLITDGVANLEQENLAETVELLKALGVHVIVVFISPEQPPEDYVNIATQPEKDFFRVNEFNQISSIYKNVTVQTCEEIFTGCSSQVDVYLVLDASGSIGEKHFTDIKKFAAHLISDIAMNADDVRIGVIIFSDNVRSIFSLNTYTDSTEMITAVETIPYTRGTTNTAQALRYLRVSGFTSSAGDRDDIPNVALILTDGNSNDRTATLDEAYLTKMAGIHLITVGIGDWTNVYELQTVASYPYQENYQPISSFSQLDNRLRHQLKDIICNGGNACSSSPCQCGGTCINHIGGYICQCPPQCAGKNCEISCREPKDLVVALDASGSVRESGFRQQVDFVQELVLMLNFNEGARLALMAYSDDVDIRFHLKDHTSKLDVLNALSLYYAGGSTNMHLALKQMYQDVFTETNGDRDNFGNVGLLFTDGRPSNRQETWKEARIARQNDIELMTVGIGPSVKLEELEDIATGPEHSHIYLTANFTTLSQTAAQIVDAVCNNVNECTSDYCKNGGTAVDLINRCECRCPPTTSGPDCNRGCANKYDIILVVDASGSIRHERFKQMLEFIVEVVTQFQVGENMARFGMVYFSDSANVQFQLNSYYSGQDVIAAIRRTRFIGGRTNIADALDMAKASVMTTANGDRSDVTNHVIVFTDGQSNIRERETMTSAILLRSDFGAKVSAVGIGNDANSLELRGIASEPVDVMAMFVASFNDIIRNQESRAELLQQIVTSTCDDTNECSPNPCQNGGQCYDELHYYWCDCEPDWTGRTCGRRCTANMDLTFILDFSGSMDQVFHMVVAFAREVTYGLPVNLGLTRVAVVSYETDGRTEFYLDKYNSKEEILNAMVFRKVNGGTTNTQEALFMTYSDVFRSSRGDRPGVDNIAVVVTDGRSNVNRENTLPRAEEARNNGVEVYVAALGENPNYREINGIATNPDSSHVISVPDASTVQSGAANLLDRLCE